MIEDLLNEYHSQTVILVDLSWVLYRSHYAFKYLSNNDGEHTGAYYGLCKTLQTFNDSYPESLILLVDDGNPIERKQLDESYKANREQSVKFVDKRYIVDCIIQQLHNTYRVYHPTLEADDLLYSISRIKKYNNQFIIYTADKDLYQSIDATTYIAKTIERGELLPIDQSSDEYTSNFMDLEPFQLPYFRAVLGDASDNLSIIRPRFPTKVAYLFAKNFIYLDDVNKVMVHECEKLDCMTDRQYDQLKEIYQNKQFIINLDIMKLEYQKDIPIIEKEKTSQEVLDELNRLQLKQYLGWLGSR